jgi:tetratricopeptide (TPR) repeat protein
MKAFKLIILLLAFIQLNALAGDRLKSTPSAIKYTLSSGSQKDTAAVNAFVRKGTKYLSSKENKLDMVKECIDSAVLICEKGNIEFPSALQLLLARYYYATDDLRSASEQAALALKQAAGSGESDVLARTYLFLGDYYRRTGFYKESIEYYNNAIEISKKKGLKHLIAISYLLQANVFNTIGDLKGSRQSLKLMIEAAFS